MSEPLSEDEIIAIVSRYEQPVPCPECRGLGTIDDMQGAIMCPSCKGNGDKSYPPPSDIIQLVAEVRRLREENDRLRDLNDGWKESANMANERGDAARADLARAIELLRCITETPTPIPGVTLGDYHEHVAAFLAEIGKR